MKEKNILNIGIVVDQLLAGGVQLAAIEQVKQLNKLGHKAKLLILMRKKYPTNFSYLVRDIPFMYLSDFYPFIFKKTIKFPVFSFLSTLHLMSPILAPRVLKKNQFDILISWGTTTCLTTQSIYKNLKIPYIAIIHDPIEYILYKSYSKTFLRNFFPILKMIANYFESSFIKDAKKTLIISKVHFEYLKKRYGVQAEVVGLGANYLKNLPKKRGDYILSFGRWQKEKNPDFLLKVLKIIPKAKLIMAGSWIVPEDLAGFREKIKKEHLEERIQIIPHFDENLLQKLCRNSRMWVHPHFEAFGLAALEAAGQGLPIIIPQRSGVTEYFTHKVHGFFPKEVSLKEYKKYILQLLNNERLAFRMGKEAANLVKKRISWEVKISSLLRVINASLLQDNLQKTDILVLETGHVRGATLAGGDKVLEPMARNLASKYQFSIIVSKIGAYHWIKAPMKKRVYILPPNLFDYSSFSLFVFLSYCIRMFQSTRIILNKQPSDLIYSSTNILPDILPCFISKNFNKSKVWVARIHHLIPLPQKREGNFLINLASYLMQYVSLYMIKQSADIIIALNENLRNELIYLNFPKNKLKVLGAGIDFKKIDKLRVRNGTPIYDGVFIGRFHPAKGIFDLIPIWKEVVRKLPKAKLAIIGTSEPRVKDRIRKLIANENLEKNMDILGYIEESRMYNILKRARVFLFTDHEAGWGIAVAEAMAAKVPVVGYDNGVLGNVYKAGYEKIPLSDTQKFAKQVIRLLKNDKRRNSLGSKARKEASKLDWTLTSKQFDSILAQTASFKL